MDTNFSPIKNRNNNQRLVYKKKSIKITGKRILDLDRIKNNNKKKVKKNNKIYRGKRSGRKY